MGDRQRGVGAKRRAVGKRHVETSVEENDSCHMLNVQLPAEPVAAKACLSPGAAGNPEPCKLLGATGSLPARVVRTGGQAASGTYRRGTQRGDTQRDVQYVSETSPRLPRSGNRA